MNPAASELAKQRWKKEKPDKEHFKRISKLGVEARKKKIKVLPPKDK